MQSAIKKTYNVPRFIVAQLMHGDGIYARKQTQLFKIILPQDCRYNKPFETILPQDCRKKHMNSD